MSVTRKIIDFRNRPPINEYSSLFMFKMYVMAGRFEHDVERLPGLAKVPESVKMVGKEGGLEQWWKENDAAGIDAVVCNGRLTDHMGSITADRLANFQKDYPGRFYGLAPVDLEQDPEVFVADVEHSIKDLGLIGVNIEPCYLKSGATKVDNPKFYPLYEKLIELDVPMMVFTGPMGPDVLFANDMAAFDRVFQIYPKLKVVLGHGGYPNIMQTLGCAFKNHGLYICPDIYMFGPGGELYRNALYHFQDQMLFGTAYPFAAPDEFVEATLRLPISAKIMDKYLYGNAARLLKIEQ